MTQLRQNLTKRFDKIWKKNLDKNLDGKCDKIWTQKLLAKFVKNFGQQISILGCENRLLIIISPHVRRSLWAITLRRTMSEKYKTKTPLFMICFQENSVGISL